MLQRSVVVLLSLAFVLPFTDSAAAGPVEQLSQVALHPTDPKVIVLRYRDGGDGFFFSRDGGESWQLQCLDAVDKQVPRGGPIVVTADGHTLMGVFQGLYEDKGNGCDFARVPEIGEIWVSDVVVNPRDPQETFATTSKGGEGVLNGIVKRDADGAYTDFGIKEELLITRLRMVPREDGLRIYQSVLKGTIPVVINGVEMQAPNYLIRYSDDNAETFTEFPFGTTDGTLRLQAVDPSNPERVVAVLDHEGKEDDVLVSENSGETFEVYMTMSQFGALAFTETGKVYLGESGISTMPGSKVGLWVADSLDSAPTKLGDYPVQCLGYQEATDTLYACQYRTFGTVDQESGEFTESFKFTEVEEFVECKDAAQTCEVQLCADYCGAGHFATAPVCQVYTDSGPMCGPCAAAFDRGEYDACRPGAAGSGAAGASGSGSAGSAGMSSEPSMAGSSANAQDAGTSQGRDSGSSGKSGSDDDDGDSGCSTAAVGRAANTTAGLVAFGATLALLLALRRRRARGQQL